ncbi:hypothetical protein IW140_003681 [Coemansia sp. RSA 1813]|nr:hypothetical protein EV178_002646 [Coemansia sp. RSA 1646]KAJ2088769.1 hypothetical protein IW138_003943 [Coemansia sp. RSA 986]KAJ2213705.1 hypothetical protein EV179_003605 [Coemansia sp. RSA 487]KAJ2568692.1 hypothetical protein IW140_003681 [Coemansia sp. RSA 1813]
MLWTRNRYKGSWRTKGSCTATALGSLSLLSGTGLYLAATKENSDAKTPTESEPEPEPQTELELEAQTQVVVDGLMEFVLTAVRSGELLIRFVPLLVLYPAVWFGECDPNRGNEKSGALWWYRLVCRQMASAGPTFIKLAQWAASRTDLFNMQLCMELGRLHDRNKEHSAAYSKNAVAKAFGVSSIDQVFESFDERPLGVGAVAQVHQARFSKEFVDTRASNGRLVQDVAVKVLHPGVERKIRRDLRIMQWGAHIVGALPGMKWLSLPEEVSIFGAMMESQVDLRNEKRNSEMFLANFTSRRGVQFPHMYLPLQAKDVLVETYCDGIPLRAFLDTDGHTPFDRELGTKGLDAFLHMLIYDNFVHADLHPGNIMVKLSPPYVGSQLDRFVEDFYDMSPFNQAKRQNEHSLPTATEAHQHIRAILDEHDAGAITTQEKKQRIHEYMDLLYRRGFTPTLIFLDCGLTTSLDDFNRHNFIDLFAAVCTFDGKKAGELMIDRCLTPELVEEPDVFILRMQDVILKVRTVSLQLSKLTFSEVFGPVMSAVRTHHVKLAPDFINIIMAMFILEGIGRRLDPDSDILRAALPMLRKWLKEDARNELTWQQRGRASRRTSLNLLKVWLYVEVREYLDRVRYWGYDDREFFGPFAPFITADSSLS